MAINDNQSGIEAKMMLAGPDPYGQAALLLVESLIHGLCENDTLTAEEAVEITDRAAAVQAEQAEQADGAGAPLRRAEALLASIAASLRMDGQGGPPPPDL